MRKKGLQANGIYSVLLGGAVLRLRQDVPLKINYSQNVL